MKQQGLPTQPLAHLPQDTECSSPQLSWRVAALASSSILFTCSHRQTLPAGCVCPSCSMSSQRVLSCALHTICSIQSLKSEPSFQWEHSRKRILAVCKWKQGISSKHWKRYLHKTSRKLIPHETVQESKAPNSSWGREAAHARPAPQGLGSHSSLDCKDSTLFSSIRLSSLPVSR